MIPNLSLRNLHSTEHFLTVLDRTYTFPNRIRPYLHIIKPDQAILHLHDMVFYVAKANLYATLLNATTWHRAIPSLYQSKPNRTIPLLHLAKWNITYTE